ncbi:HigA family addiction module antitoxin [Maricaulis sp.]|uniref:HigA family addiction module antitoxin n=1 Tax=Maricaulis sp. TaxID=1486257 RepID=UPI003A8F52D6
MTKLDAIPPGEILLEDFLRPNGLTQEKLSLALDVPKSRISGLVRGTRSITADTALRLSAFFGTTAEFWMNLQAEYDLRQARATSWPAIAPRIVPHRAA